MKNARVRISGATSISADPLDFVGDGYARFRRYAPRLLTALDLKGGRAARPVLQAIAALRELNAAGDTGAPPTLPADFVRSKWRRRVIREDRIDRRMWETALLFALRDGLRSGDLWIEESRRHQAFSTALAPMTAVANAARLAVPLNPAEWIAGRKAALAQRDQAKNERSIAKSLKDRVRQSEAVIFLVSPTTLSSGAAQWMELAYADAYSVPTFVLLHHLTFMDLKSLERGIPPLLLEGQCNSASDWKAVATGVRTCLAQRNLSNA